MIDAIIVIVTIAYAVYLVRRSFMEKHADCPKCKKVTIYHGLLKYAVCDHCGYKFADNVKQKGGLV